MKIFYLVFNLSLFALIAYVLYAYFKGGKEIVTVSEKKKPISSTTPKKGVQVDVMKAGVGKEAKSGRLVQVHYTAWLENGKKVDSSYDKGQIFAFEMGKNQVIPGWEAGMIGMKEGEERKFTIAPEQAYGSKGKANVPPNAVIVFQVELLKVI